MSSVGLFNPVNLWLSQPGVDMFGLEMLPAFRLPFGFALRSVVNSSDIDSSLGQADPFSARWLADQRAGRQLDLAVAASGGGEYGSSCPEGIPVELALLSLLAAFGVAFGVLYTALTLQTMGRRRRAAEEEGSCSAYSSTRELLSCSMEQSVVQGRELLYSYVPEFLWSGK